MWRSFWSSDPFTQTCIPPQDETELPVRDLWQDVQEDEPAEATFKRPLRQGAKIRMRNVWENVRQTERTP